MDLALRHKVALVGAALTSAIALTDAITHGLTGHYSPFSDDTDLLGVAAAGSVVHGLAYLGLCWVLVAEAGRFASTNRVARVARWVVTGSLALLAPGFVLVAPVVVLQDVDSGMAYDLFGAVASAGFAGLILGSLVLGLALLRNPAAGIGGRLLSLLLPVFGLTLLLAWLAPAWAHPAYLETVIYFGLALLGAGAGAAVTPRERTDPVPASTR
jgi:hypothetical protein